MIPKDFVWGTSTASYQIEGAPREDGKGENIWDRFSHVPGNICDNQTGDDACDSYHNVKEDAILSEELGVNAYRFSISWSRVLPNGVGEINEKGMEYYNNLIDELLSRGIEPYVTIYHWDLPQKIQDKGGWSNIETADAYLNYAKILFIRFGSKVKYWTTLNEPWVVSFPGHYEGVMAPGLRDFSTALQVAHTQLVGHGKVVRLFRDMKIKGEIGVTLNLSPKESCTQQSKDIEAAHRCDGYMNRWFLDPLYYGKYPEDMVEWYETHHVKMPETSEEEMRLIAEPFDFLGINYYNIDYTRYDSGKWPIELTTGHANGYPITNYKMAITPEGIYKLLVRLEAEYKPKSIYITENGASFRDEKSSDGKIHDSNRIKYIKDHIEYCNAAIEKGIPLKGYFVWSMFDNFEWNTGYSNWFGLVQIDRKTMERTKKDSFYWYRDMIKRSRLNASIIL
ncbi:MAG: GH1 family beta-glucosidase [Suipraeoptans sp.]